MLPSISRLLISVTPDFNHNSAPLAVVLIVEDALLYSPSPTQAELLAVIVPSAVPALATFSKAVLVPSSN